MQRSFGLIEQIRDAVDAQAGLEGSEIARTTLNAARGTDRRVIIKPARNVSFTTSRKALPERLASAFNFATTSSSSVSVVRMRRG